MRASVTLVIRLPGDDPAVGARVIGVNHDAVSRANRDLSGTTDAHGSLTWPDVDVAPLGTRLTLEARYADPEGEEWYAKTSERVFGPTTITMTLDLA
jgi:hypothetical protein